MFFKGYQERLEELVKGIKEDHEYYSKLDQSSILLDFSELCKLFCKCEYDEEI